MATQDVHTATRVSDSATGRTGRSPSPESCKNRSKADSKGGLWAESTFCRNNGPFLKWVRSKNRIRTRPGGCRDSRDTASRSSRCEKRLV